MNTTPTQVYELARDFVLHTNKNIFITGKAGTGKTTFLHQLKEQTLKQLAVVAPTGVAAINAGGTTIHSFFQLPFHPFLPTTQGRKQLIDTVKMRSYKRKLLQELELLVIDEISMVRADVLDAIDTMLRHVRYRFREPFGGVQVIFIGDMFQLSPVVSDDEWQLLSEFYTSPYFFHSRACIEKEPVYVELDTIFRQSELNFVTLLNEVRNDCLSRQSIALLQERFQPDFQPPAGEHWITLTTHNTKADRINALEMVQIDEPLKTFAAKIEGDFPEKSYPMDMDLQLKVGARVMMIRNDMEQPRRYYNGKIGIVKAFSDGVIQVYCAEDDQLIDITPVEWENIHYTTNAKTNQIETHIHGKFIQYPLRLAWAITIHKSQGLTFDRAVIDAGRAFAPGQVYVALSRCRTLEGIVLLSSINPDTISNDRLIIEHQRNKPDPGLLENELERSVNEFRLYTIGQMFDYQSALGQFSRFVKQMEAPEKTFSAPVIPYLQEVETRLKSIEDVGSRFMMQLKAIFNAPAIDEDFLTERLEAAARFFKEQLRALIDQLKQSPANTDNKELAEEYNDSLKNLHNIICLKLHLLRQIRHPYQSDDFFNSKQSYIVPDSGIQAYSKQNKGTHLNISNRTLYFRLVELRNRLCEENETPIYLIASSKSLQEMTEYLPQSKNELMLIHGFGKAKVEKYGSLFLEVISDYCMENSLTSKMYEKQPADKKKKKKKSTE